jgi:NADP-dependent 3-hydroxy acid dehydrogenase YdfG
LETVYRAENVPGVIVYNASMMATDDILTSTVEHLRTGYDIDVLGGVVAAQVVAPALREADRGTILFTGGGFADNPVPVLASLSIGKAGLRSAATLIGEGVGDDNVHAAASRLSAKSNRERISTRTTSRRYWTAHDDVKDQWQSEYHFEGK